MTRPPTARAPTMEARKLADRIYRALRREALKVERDDWEKDGVSNVERDRYVQGMRDAATMVLQAVYVPSATPKRRGKGGRR